MRVKLGREEGNQAWALVVPAEAGLSRPRAANAPPYPKMDSRFRGKDGLCRHLFRGNDGVGWPNIAKLGLP